MTVSTLTLWEELNIPLRKYIKKRIPESDVDDILQSVFCKIHDGIDKVRNKDKIHSWVFQIAHHAIVDYYRTRKETVDISAVQETSIDSSDSEVTQD